MWRLVRTIGYVVAILCSILTFHRASVELLVAGVLAVVFLPVLHFAFHCRQSTSIFNSLLVEAIVLFVLWGLFLGGAAAMAHQLGGFLDDRYCRFTFCGVGRALEAFSWLTWVTLTFLLVLALTFGITGTLNKHAGVWTASFKTGVAGGGKKSTAAATGTTAPEAAGTASTIAPAAAPAAAPANVETTAA
ncbi:hypothetical protein JCM5296_007527 [Sporobolomyces johnsonii]